MESDVIQAVLASSYVMRLFMYAPKSRCDGGGGFFKVSSVFASLLTESSWSAFSCEIVPDSRPCRALGVGSSAFSLPFSPGTIGELRFLFLFWMSCNVLVFFCVQGRALRYPCGESAVLTSAFCSSYTSSACAARFSSHGRRFEPSWKNQVPLRASFV